MAMSTPSAAVVKLSSTFDLEENQKRWLVVGVGLHRVLLPVLRDFVGQELPKHYTSLKSVHGIDTQVFKGPHFTHDGPFKLNYGSINNNWVTFKRKETAYDYKVNTAEDLAKLYLEPHMAKFTGFDNSCDLSAVLGILANASIFPTHIQTIAKDVRSKVRNEWGHCNFDHWTDPEMKNCFQFMENLLRSLGLPNADEAKVITDLCDWKEKGLKLCMGCPVDKDLMDLVKDQVANLEHDVQVMKKSNVEEAQKISKILQNVKLEIANCCARLTELEETMIKVKERQDLFERKVDDLERKRGETDSKLEELKSSMKGGLKTSTNDIAFLAPRRNACFCGRDSELGSIAANLKGTTSGCALTAICGLGGVGKTSLAIEFSWRHKDQYPGGVFWISGENNRVFQNSVREMTLEMQITFENDFSFTLTKALAWLKRQSQLWCLVVDNLDELEMSEDMRKLVRGKWQLGARGHVIITTRKEPREIHKETGIEQRSCIELKCLLQEESTELLRKQTGKMTGEEDEEICELAIELGGLPLALDQAAAYIRYLSCSIKEYVEQYRDQKGKLLKKMETQEPDECTSHDRLAVHTTWLMNFEHITNSSRYPKEVRVAATLVMEISAYLGPDDIPFEVINQGLPQIDFPSLVDVMSNPLGRKEVMSLLTKLSLFQQFGENSYCVHRLVQEVIRSWMDEKRKDDAFNKEFFTKEFSFIAGTRFMHHAFVNTCSPVKVCEDLKDDAAVFGIKNPPSLHLWGKLASHATYFQEHMLDFTTKNEESVPALLYTEETVRLLNEVAISSSVALEKVQAQEIQKRKLEFLTHLEQLPSEETLKITLYFNMPLKNRYYKLISHCMKERPSSREDLNNAESDANRLREEGNQAVNCKEYEKALGLYTKAIELYPKDYRLYCNRALCYLKLSKPQNAVGDCDQCLKLKPYYSKALQRKAWALHELVGGGSDHLKGCAEATAALAIYGESSARTKQDIKTMFPDLCFAVVDSTIHLEFALQQMPQTNDTFLLREGKYNVSRFGVGSDLQFVGLGSGAIINCKGPFVVRDAKCYFENVTFSIGNHPLICCGQTAVIRMSHCQVSAGEGCQDYPECNGGQGCIAASLGRPPCERTNAFGSIKPSGILGSHGVQLQQGSTGYIDHCQIHNCGDIGAAVQGEGSCLFVRNCEVYRNRHAGLMASNGGQLVASENKVYDNGTYGIFIGPDAGCCSICSNTIFENHRDGVEVIHNKQVLVDSNDIHHNMGFGLLSDYSQLSIINNKIFENVFWGIFCKSKTSANIKANEIFSNQCGGIIVGINFSGEVAIQSNVVRDHAGPWLQYPDERHFRDKNKMRSDVHLPPGETKCYSIPPTEENNQTFNNVEGLFHPGDSIEEVQSRCCHCSKHLCKLGLTRCPKCYIGIYCGKDCLENHLPQHKSLCALLKSRYSTTVEFASLPLPMGHFKHVEFGPPCEGPRPEKNSRQAFIVKVKTSTLNCHPKQLLLIFDRSGTVDCLAESPEVFEVTMECGVLSQFYQFTSKEAFFWATFADGGKGLDIFLNHLAPYQDWSRPV